MQTKCSVCGKKFNLFDLIAQTPVCLACEKAGAKDPGLDPKIQEAESQIFLGRCLEIGAVAITILVVFVPTREGASPSSKWRLLSIAFIMLGAGIGRIASAKRKIRQKPR